jgi:hypothetical protein
MSRALVLSAALLAALHPAAAAQLTDLQTGRNYASEANFGLNRSENIDFGDCDNDGDMDVIVGNGGDFGPEPNRIFINRGGLQGGTVGTFVEETSTRFAGVPNDTSRDIEFVDIDNDDDLDVYVSNRGPNPNTGEPSRFYVNLGGPQGGTIGFYQDQTATRWGTLVSVPLADEVGPQDGQGPFKGFTCDCDFADLDDDGHSDLFHSSYGPNIDGTHDSLVFLNDSTGVFDELWPWCFGVQGASMDIRTHTFDLDLVDLDADFDLDVVMSSRNSQARVYLNNLYNGISGSPFNDITQYALLAQGATMNGNSNYAGEYGDVDGDGDFDVWMQNYNGFSDRILRNDGFTAGSGVKFTQQNNFIKNDPVNDEQHANYVDFDGDGDLDVFVANFSGTNYLYVSGLAQGLNSATTGLYHRAGASGSIYAQGELPTGNPGGLTTLDGDTADVDNDGDQDLAVSNDSNQQNYLYRNALGIPDTHAPSVHLLTNQADKANGTDTVIHAQLRDNNSYCVVHFYDVNLVYTVDGGSAVSLDMFAQGSMQFRGLIPAQTDAVVSYHIEATDLAGNTTISADFGYVQGTLGDPWTDVGCSLAGVSGPPLLVGSGPLTTGSAGSLALSNAAPSASCLLFVSLSSTPVGFKGGTLCAFPFAVTLPLGTDGSGALTLPWASWPSGLSGSSLFFQYAIADAAGPAGASLSNAERADVP